ncbi:hypothetical protein PDIDSM_2471 [Penicillium digitatum]|nr:hypothetical protein PDIDSM_2471 [Penicillium digitatum]
MKLYRRRSARSVTTRADLLHSRAWRRSDPELDGSLTELHTARFAHGQVHLVHQEMLGKESGYDGTDARERRKHFKETEAFVEPTRWTRTGTTKCRRPVTSSTGHHRAR